MLNLRRFRFSVMVFLTLVVVVMAMAALDGYQSARVLQTHSIEARQLRLSGMTRYVQEYVDNSLDFTSNLQASEIDGEICQQLLPILQRQAKSNPGNTMGIYSLASGAIVATSHGLTDEQQLSKEEAELYQSVVNNGSQFRQVEKRSQGFTTYMTPLRVQGKVIGVVFADEPLSILTAEVAEDIRRIWINSIVKILAGLLAAMFLTHSLTTNVVQLVQGIRKMEQDATLRLPILPGEFGEVAHAINNLTRSLRDNQELLYTLLRRLPVGVMVLDRDGMVTYFNETAAQQTLLSRDEVMGQHYSAKFPDIAILARVLNEGALVTDEIYRGPLLNRGQVALRVYGAPLRDEQGMIIGAIHVFSDITASDQLEQANRQLLEQIRQAEKLATLGELAAGTAHEIRNPLMVIQGFVKLTHDHLDKESPEREWLDIALVEASRINAITQEFLLLAKPTAPQRIPTDVLKVIKETLQMVDSTAFGNRVKIETDFAEPGPICSADAQQLKQVFLNLFNNAIQAMPGGGTLTVEVLHNRPQSQCVVKVKDTGIGISPEHHSKVFDPFFTTRDQGTGLGLTVTARIIQNHQGNIDFTSRPGEGTTFIITLPVQQI